MHHQPQTEESLQGWASAATDLHLMHNMPLTEAVTQVLRPHAQVLTAEHARRVCEKTHHTAFARLYQGLSSSPERFVSFDGGPPDAGVVARTLELRAVTQKSEPVAGPTSMHKQVGPSSPAHKAASAPNTSSTPGATYMPQAPRTLRYDPQAQQRQVLSDKLAQVKLAQAQAAATPSPKQVAAHNQRYIQAQEAATRKMAADCALLEIATPVAVMQAKDTALMYMRAGYSAREILKIACDLLPQNPPPCLMALAEEYAHTLREHGGDLQSLKTAAEVAFPERHVPDPSHPVVVSFKKAASAVLELEVATHARQALAEERALIKKQAGIGEAGVAAAKTLGRVGVSATKMVGEGAAAAGRRFGDVSTPYRNLGMATATAAMGAKEIPGVAAAGHGTYQSLVNPHTVRMAE